MQKEYASIWHRFVVTTGAETLSVFVGALSGFLIVNRLPISMYAQYTFLVTCVTFAVGLSDVGLSHCYLPIVGNRTNDTDWVLSACRRVYQLRGLLLMPGGAVVFAYWLYSTRAHLWFQTDYLLASLVGMISVGFSLREQVSRTLLIILQRVRHLNKSTAIGNCTRLILVMAVLYVVPTKVQISGLLFATIFGSAATLIWNRRLKEVAAFGAAKLSPSDQAKVDVAVGKLVKPLILPVLFYQVQGVITVFLVSLFAATNSIAEVGALSRPTLILVIADRITGVLLFPAIARVSNSNQLLQLLVRAHVGYLSLMALLFSSSFWGADAWISLIGEQYLPQKPLLWMVFLSAILMNAAGFAFTTLSAQGRTSRQGMLIPLVLTTQILFLLRFGVSDTRSALALSICTSTVFFLFQYSLLIINFRPKAAIEQYDQNQ